MSRDVVSVRMTIANSFYPVLEWVQQATGSGSIISKPAQSTAHKAGHQWVVNAATAGTIIRQIEPYMKIKPKQAAHALDILERLHNATSKADRSWQLAARNAMCAMNKRGPQKE